MNFTITPIGVNSAFTAEGFQTNFLVRSSAGAFLLDCGTTANRAFRRLSGDLIDVENVYISHMHLDHTGGLFELGLRRHFSGLPRPRLYLHADLEEVIWQGFLQSMMSKLAAPKGGSKECTLETFFEVHPLPATWLESAEPYDIAGTPVRLVRVNHSPGMSCHGLVLADRCFVTTDCIFDMSLLERVADAFGLETIIHDCSFNPEAAPVHATYEQLCSLPGDLRQLLTLVHYEEDIHREDCPLPLAQRGESYEF